MKNNSSKCLISLVVVLLILVVGLGGYVLCDKIILKDNNRIQENLNSNSEVKENNDIDSSNKNENLNSSEYNQYIGMTTISGYATIEKVEYCKYEDYSNCESQTDAKYHVNYVYFHILDSKDKDFLEYSNKYKETNLPDSNNVIGLGCVIGNKLHYDSLSDELKIKSIYLSENYTKKLLNSSKNNPISLQVLKLKVTSGTDLVDCISDVTYFTIED